MKKLLKALKQAGKGAATGAATVAVVQLGMGTLPDPITILQGAIAGAGGVFIRKPGDEAKIEKLETALSVSEPSATKPPIYDAR